MPNKKRLKKKVHRKMSRRRQGAKIPRTAEQKLEAKVKRDAVTARAKKK